jgi:thiamine pyrophosphate-dependent acetolactate synthase large subunit-like protein
MLPGVANAWGDSSPILAITPNVQTFRAYPHVNSIQALDHYRLFEPITKWNAVIREWKRIPELVHRALRHALSGRRGPVHLDIPVDVLFEWNEEVPLSQPERYRAMGRVRGDQELVRKAVGMLAKSDRPLMVAGGGVLASEAWAEFTKIAEHLSIPCTTTTQGPGSIPADHPLWIGDGGWMGGESVVKAFHEADVVLAVGCRFSEWIGFGQPPIWGGAGQKIIHVDIDPNEIGKNVEVAIGIVGDAKAILAEILSELVSSVPRYKGARTWLQELKETRSSYLASLEDAVGAITFPRVLKEIRNFLDRDAIVAFDGGQTHEWATCFVSLFEPRTKLFSAGLGHLGFGLPMSLGAKLGNLGKQVCNIAGDGAFMLTCQELETAARYKIPVVNVVFNDKAWGTVRYGQIGTFGREVGTTLTDVDFGKLAQAMGCYGERVTIADEIKPALRRAFESGKPAVLDVMIESKPYPMDKWWDQTMAGCYRGLPDQAAVGAPISISPYLMSYLGH